MDDSLLRLLRAQQAQKRLAFQIENVLFGDRARRTIAAAEHVGQLASDAYLVIGDRATLAHRPPRIEQIPHRVLAERGDGARNRRDVIRCKVEHARLRVCKEPVTVHRDAIGHRPEETE